MSDEYHVTPVNDLREHEDTPKCWCKPVETDPGVWVHNSMDRREEYEQGRKPQ